LTATTVGGAVASGQASSAETSSGPVERPVEHRGLALRVQRADQLDVEAELRRMGG
jgi:hypothetical protein